MKSLPTLGAGHQGAGNSCSRKVSVVSPTHRDTLTRTTNDTVETKSCLLGQGQTFGPSETGGPDQAP